MELINRLLDLPRGDSTGAMEQHMKLLADATGSDACVTLLDNPGEGTFRLLDGVGLMTPHGERPVRFETVFLGEKSSAYLENRCYAVAGPFDGDPFLTREKAGTLLLRPLRAGDLYLVTAAWRRHHQAFTVEEEKKFSTMSGVINLIRFYWHFSRLPDVISATDDLTGLGLFPDFHQNMVKEVSRARRSGGTLAMGIMSIVWPDGKVTDEALVEITRKFRNQLRNFDTLDRYGPGELAFILSDLKSAEGIRVVERVLGEIVPPPVGAEKSPDFYIGLSCYPEDGSTVERLIEMAEAAMNKAVEESTPGVYRWRNQATDL